MTAVCTAAAWNYCANHICDVGNQILLLLHEVAFTRFAACIRSILLPHSRYHVMLTTTGGNKWLQKRPGKRMRSHTNMHIWLSMADGLAMVLQILDSMHIAQFPALLHGVQLFTNQNLHVERN